MVINELLNDKNMSRYKLSKVSGVPQTTITDICSGKTSIEKCSAGTLYKIAKALDVSMESLLGEENKSKCGKIKTLQIDDTAIPYDENDPRYAPYKMTDEERRDIEMELKLITKNDEEFITDLLDRMDKQDEISLDKNQMNKLCDIIRKSNILLE